MEFADGEGAHDDDAKYVQHRKVLDAAHVMQ